MLASVRNGLGPEFKLPHFRNEVVRLLSSAMASILNLNCLTLEMRLSDNKLLAKMTFL